jgi:ASC-1-like (ASCH) protein
MKIFDINVQEPYFGYIVAGKKTVEGRLHKGKFLDVRVGDILNINGAARYTVLEKNIYPTFRAMIETEGLDAVIPDKHTVDDGVAVYYKFFTREDENTYGVVALKIARGDA